MSVIAEQQTQVKMQIGDKAYSFEEMVELNKGILFKVANTYCKNEADGQDLLQEIMIQLWRSFERYNNQYKISTWIYTIALNVAISFDRKRSTQTKYVSQLSDRAEQIADTEPPDKEQQLLRLEQFISELKELDKALMLLYLDEKSHKEMAEILGISESNVATKIGRIKEKLRNRFLKSN
jgi:RNA polymerase sigma factor (sigma-70 family)